MIELYLDTVDVKQIIRFNACLPIKGVTANPTILDNAGVGVNEALSEIVKVIGAETRFHVQVVSQAGSRYFCESLFWASQPKQVAKT